MWLMLKKHQLYYLLMTVSGVVGLLKTVLYANILSPEELGNYSIALIVSTYGIYFCSCGLYEGAMGILPQWYGEGRSIEIELIRNKIISFTLVSSLILATIIGLFFQLNTLSNFSTITFVYLGLLLACPLIIFLILLADLRSRLMTVEFSCMIFVRSILSLSFGIFLAADFGAFGIIISELLITIFLTIILSRFKIYRLRLDFSEFTKLKPIFRVGLPLMFNGLFSTASSNIDKVFIVSLQDAKLLGYYSFAMILSTGTSLIQSILYQQIGPEILYKIGQGNCPISLFKKLNKIIMLTLLLLIISFYPFSRLAQYAISNYFPQYTPAYPIIEIVYVGASMIIVSLYDNFTIALQKSERLLFLNILVTLLISALFLLCLQFDLSILYFAAVYSLGRLLYFAGTFLLAKWSVKNLSLSQTNTV